MTTDKEELKDLKFYMNNAMDDFVSTPISVLRYITELESKLEAKDKEIKKLKEQVLIGDIYADSVARDAFDAGWRFRQTEIGIRPESSQDKDTYFKQWNKTIIPT